MTDAAVAMPSRMCEGCGTWQRVPAESACAKCRWPRLVAGRRRVGRAELRVLIDVVLRSDGTWDITGFTSPRIDVAVDRTLVLQRLNDETLRHLLSNDRRGSFPSQHAWSSFREKASSLLADELNSVIRQS